MRIFVGYSFNDRDQWIPDLAFRLIRAFGDEPVTGEELNGDQITDEVINRIGRSSAVIGFATRRQQVAQDRWTAHRWVLDELATAHALRASRASFSMDWC